MHSNKPNSETEAAIPDETAESIAVHATGWFSAWRERLHLLTELAVAEAKLAAISVALMAFFGTLAALCLLVAWGLLVAGLVNVILLLGVPLWSVLLGLALVHLIVAGLLTRSVFKLGNHLSFSETRGQLRREEVPS